ncbi:hypothetical protein JXB02_04300 [Candidatus Woesearchaeota archaeon]|nr:hypothetical protein [Candidatus Woesearchaeota archaeon]
MRAAAERMLKDITGKRHIIFVERGNEAIRLSLGIVRGAGYDTVRIQDQGGWMKYEDYARGWDLSVERLPTDHGIITGSQGPGAYLINSMPGYHAAQEMGLFPTMREQGLLINDASGSIGTGQAKRGDLVLGSFGRWKPVWLGSGGFIATDYALIAERLREQAGTPAIDYAALEDRLAHLPARLHLLRTLRAEAAAELAGLGLPPYFPDHPAINLIVPYLDATQKERIIKFAASRGFETRECPHPGEAYQIRVADRAVSIEIKRTEGW